MERFIGKSVRHAGWIVAAALLVLAAPVQAAVTLTFWSRDFGNYFPHAFITLRGVPHAGGAAVNAAYGFTAKRLTPAILFGRVPGRIERPKPGYMAGAHVHFSVELTDAQYAEVLALIRGWSAAETGESRYDLNRRNCVHFVREAASRAGLVSVTFPRLMKKPHSYLNAVAAANAGAVRPIEQIGSTYLVTLPPLETSAPVAAPESDPGTVPGATRLKRL